MATNYQKRKQILLHRPVTLMDLAKAYEERVWKSPKHREQCFVYIREASEILGNPKISEITTDTVERWVDEVSDGLRPASINRRLSALRKLLQLAHDREWLAKMPKFDWKPEDNLRIRWLSPEEERQLLSLLPEDVSAFCEILIHTGMRRGELLGMQRDQIDGNYVRLWKTKNGKARSVPLSDRAKELIDQWIPFDLKVSRIRTEWLRAKKAMGLEDDKDFVLHMLRHTTATRMLDTTENIVAVQRMLGHSRLETTMRYAHLSDESLLDAVRRTTSKHAQNAA